MKKSAVLNPFAALLILSAALILFSGPAQAYVYDNFTGSGINPKLWTDIGPNTGLFSQPSGGPLYFINLSGHQGDMLESHNPVSGAFFVSMQFSNFAATNTSTGEFTGSSVGLWVGDVNDLYMAVYSLKESGAVRHFRANSDINGSRTHLGPAFPQVVDNGWLGVGFNGVLGSGGELTFWYKDGSGWTELASAAPDFSSDPYFGILGDDLNGISLRFRVHEVDLTPLPPSALLLGSGLLGLVGWRGFKKS